MTEWRLTQLCETLKRVDLEAALEGEDRAVTGVNTLEAADGHDISFLSNKKYLKALAQTRAGAVIVPYGVPVPSHVSAVRCADPYAAVTVTIVTIHGYRKHPQWGISERATIHQNAVIGKNANIGPGVYIGSGVTIGADFTAYPGCYVADGVQVGDECTLHPNVVIYEDCKLGNRVTIHAGSVIGQDGLGYAPRGQHWAKIPQIGHTTIGDDVEIGANCAIDRATLGETLVGDGTKFGNVVVIGHGTQIGPDCLLVGQVGVAGSVNIGRHVTLAGQVGVAGHLTIGDNARIGAQSGVGGDVPPGSELLGSPAFPIDKAKRAVYAVQKLPEWTQRIKDLEQELESLRRQLAEQTEPTGN